MLPAMEVSLLLGALSEKSWETRVRAHKVHVYVDVCACMSTVHA